MAVPRHLVVRLGRREIKASLGTNDLWSAKLRSRALSNSFDMLFKEVASMPTLTTAMIEDRVRGYFQSCLNHSLERAQELPADPFCDIGAEVAYLRDSVAQMRALLSSQSFSSGIVTDADELLKPAYGQDAPSLDMVQFARSAVLRAKIENARILAAQLSGHYDETLPKDPMFSGMAANGLPPLPHEELLPLTEVATLRTIGKKYLAFKSKHDFAAKTAGDVKRVLALAYEVIGADKLVQDISTDDIKALRDLIGTLPPNYMKGASKAALTAKEASAENADGQALSPLTQEKYLRLFKSVMAWASDEGYIAKTPGVKVKVAGAGKLKGIEGRNPYSTSQLQMIFASPLYTGHRSASSRHRPGDLLLRDGKFWTPLIALYAGMRMGEIVQLLAADVKQDAGIWFFDVTKTEGDGKKLKTISSIRRVPVHNALIDAGFLKFVKPIASAGRLFPDIERGSDGYYSHNLSKWWGRYASKVGFAAPKTAFHSFRHNFKDALRAADVPQSVSMALMGHADGSVHGSYGSGPSLQLLKVQLDRATYPIELAPHGQ